MGIATIPVWTNQSAVTFPIVEKKPAVSTWREYQPGGRLPTERELRAWFGSCRPGQGLAVVTGWRGLVVLDFDDLTVWNRWTQWATAVARSYTVMTPRPGAHVYLFVDEPVRNSPFYIDDRHVGDVRGRGGYVVAPPSVRADGAYLPLHADGGLLRVARLADVLPEARLRPPPLARPLSKQGGGGVGDDPPTVASNVRPGPGFDPLHRVKAAVRACDLLPDGWRPSGNGYGLARCPLHDDQHPSLLINLATGDVKCAAGCAGGRWLDSIGLYQRMAGVTCKQAVADLAARLP